MSKDFQWKWVSAQDLRKVGSDAGSKAAIDCDVCEYLQGSWLMLGHSANRMEMVVVKEGPLVKRFTGWERVWCDEDSGNVLDYDIYIPKHEDPDFIALGVVFVFRNEKRQEPRTRIPCAVVHKSLCEPTQLGDMIWNDEGVDGRWNINLNVVPKVGTVWPSVATYLPRCPQAFKLKDEVLSCD